jgi:hypothetical protein
MCWLRFTPVWASAMIFFLAWSGVARGETIFRFEYTFTGAAPLHTTHIPFSIRAGNARGPVIFDRRLFQGSDLHKTFTLSQRNDADFERFVGYLLNGRRDTLQFRFATDKKNLSETEVCWGDKNDSRIDLKGMKINNLHMRIESFRYVPPVQREWDAFWKVKVSFWSSTPSVPAPKAFWGGLGISCAMAARKWVVASRMAGNWKTKRLQVL